MIKELYERIYEEIRAYETIIIHRHLRPDPDALGSQLGLAYLIKNKFPEKNIRVVGSEVDSLTYLGVMDQIEDKEYAHSLVIVTDTANRPRIDDKRYSQGEKLIKIDHHPNDDEYGDIRLVNTKASSCSEIIADLSIYLGERLPMVNKAARVLYAGMIGDTGRFLYPSTTAHTLRTASYLMGFDFSASEVAQSMNTNSQKIAQLSGYVLQNLKISENGVGSIILSREVLDKFDVNDDDTAPVVPLPGTIEGVICWGIFVEQVSGYYRCRLRSKGPVINEVAKAYNGGGHPLASGANAKDKHEINEILTAFDALVRDWQKE